MNGFDVHLEAVSAGGSVAALLTHKRLFPSMFGRFVHAQLCPGQERFGTLGTLQRDSDSDIGGMTALVRVERRKTHCVGFGVTVDLHHVKSQVLLVHKLFRTHQTLTTQK